MRPSAKSAVRLSVLRTGWRSVIAAAFAATTFALGWHTASTGSSETYSAALKSLELKHAAEVSSLKAQLNTAVHRPPPVLVSPSIRHVVRPSPKAEVAPDHPTPPAAVGPCTSIWCNHADGG